MNVKELMEKLKDLPEDAIVFGCEDEGAWWIVVVSQDRERRELAAFKTPFE